MKFKKLALLPLAACAVFSTTALAADVITFKGKVQGSTCIPKLNGGAASGDVKLPDVIQSMFPSTGNTTGVKNFTIDLSDCKDAAGTIVKAYFYQAAANAAGRLTKNSGTGSGWTYQILAGASGNNAIKVGTSGSSLIVDPNDPGATPTGGNGQLKYRVRYYNEGTPITNGTMEAKATYVLYTN